MIAHAKSKSKLAKNAVRGVRLLAVAVVMLSLSSAAWAAEAPSFLKNGDVWIFHGDSITNADTYRRMCERVFRHYHPKTEVEFINAGVWGSSSSDLAKRLQEQKRKPTVVTLMLGMNNAINGGWVKGMPRDGALKGYRADLEGFVRKSRADGAAVILMSPTLTDDSIRHTFYRLDGAIDFLLDCRKIAQEVAAAEGASYLPVQEEFEAYQNTLERRQKLRPDGVHPSSLGEYQIARTLWERLNFAGAITPDAKRVLTVPAARLPLRLKASAPRLGGDAKAIQFALDVPANAATDKAHIAWSLGEQRGAEDIALKGATTWTLAPPKGLPPLKPGEATDAIVEVRAGNRLALFIVDLCAVSVLHLKDNAATGTLESPVDRPEGRQVASWKAVRDGNELQLDIDVVDSDIQSAAKGLYALLFQRDNLSLYFDFRPTERFGDINLDTDVYQVIVNYQEKPFAAAVLRPWLGAGFSNAAAVGSEKTPQGYRVYLRIADNFDIQTPFPLADRDFVGLALEVRDINKNGNGVYESLHATQPRDQYANNMMILDLNNKLTGDSAINVHVF